MIRNIVFILMSMSFFSLNAFAYKDSYRVIGFQENGVPVIGTIYTNDELYQVRGELMDTEGNTHEFVGRWNGWGQITGQNDEGVTVDLKTNL